MVGDRLRSYRLGCGTQVLPGVTQEQVTAFERHNGVLLPVDVRDYYLAADGMIDGDSDDCLISFWQLSRIEAAPDDLNKRLSASAKTRYFFFADFLIDSHHFAMRLSESVAEPGPIATTGVRSGGCRRRGMY